MQHKDKGSSIRTLYTYTTEHVTVCLFAVLLVLLPTFNNKTGDMSGL